MDMFDDFPSVPRNVDQQTRLFLLAVRAGILQMNDTMSGMGSGSGARGPAGPAGEKGQAGADGDDGDGLLLMGG